jgi:hypothetical protein
MGRNGLDYLLTRAERESGEILARRVLELVPGLTNLDYVRALAKKRGWRSRRAGSTNAYPLAAVLEEVKRRQAAGSSSG